MITLHYYPGNANLTPHMLLEELGVPFELVLVDRVNGAHKSAEFLKLNPNGRIPVLVDGDLVLFETAAICLHLVDTHADAHLAPPLATPERAHFYKWLIWSSNTLHAMLIGLTVTVLVSRATTLVAPPFTSWPMAVAVTTLVEVKQ